MEPMEQPDCEAHILIVLSTDRTKVRLVADADRFCFPSVTVPRWQRAVQGINQGVRDKWAWNAICLFAPKITLPDRRFLERHYQVMECDPTAAGNGAETVWMPTHLLSQASFRNADDHLALQQSLAQCGSYADDPATPFVAPGWFKDLEVWTASVLRPLGLQLSGRFCQWNASRAFSLIRFETNGPAVWFKAVGHPNLREFTITLALSRLFSQFLPGVLAARTEWHGWLTTEFQGSALDTSAEVDLWRNAAHALGELQIESCTMRDELITAGCRDLRSRVLLQLVDPFMEVMTGLMEKQMKTSPPPLSEADILVLARRIKAAIEELAELAIPDALGHLDLNPGNVLNSDKRCVFLDWADAYVGPPFLTFEYLRAHASQAGGRAASLGSAVTGAYAEHWREHLAAETVAKAFRLSRLVAVFAYASGTELWRDENRISETHTAGYLRSLTRRMHREAATFAENASARDSVLAH